MKWVIVLGIFILLLDINIQTEALDVVTMDSYKTEVNLKWGSKSSGILKSHDKYSYPTGMQKTMMITAALGGVVASIRLLDLRPKCADNLTLFDDVYRRNTVRYCNTWTSQSKDNDIYEAKSFYAASGRLGVTFTTARTGSTFFYDGFQLTYTAATNRPCSNSDFPCSNGRCISKDLKCDGHNHCGDQSDRSACGAWNAGKLTGIAFGVVFLIIAIVLIAFYTRRRCNTLTQTETVVTTHPPPVYPANPQPVYPPPAYTTYPQGHTNPTYR